MSGDREQESSEQGAQRAGVETWARTNEALRRTLELLAAEPELDKFLGHVLRSVAEQLSERFGAVWLYDPLRDTLRLRISLEDGTIREVDAEDGPGYEFNVSDSEAGPTTRLGETRVLVRRRGELEDEPGFVPFREYFGRFEFPSTLTAPLFLGERLVGSLCIHSTSRETYADDELELAGALAGFAALAVELTRLSERANETALARERERAAQELAAELTKANEALRGTIDRLAGEPEPDAFLRHVLMEMRAQVGGIGVALFQLDAATATLGMRMRVEEGRVTEAPAIEGLDAFLARTPVDVTPYWQTLVEGRRPLLLDAEDPAQAYLFWPGTREWHLRSGETLALGVPLLMGDEALGFVGLTFPPGTHLSTLQLATAQALAHQATLAIQMKRLAEAARRSAVLEERNRMARDIHDTLAQAFTGIVIQLEAARRILDAAEAEAQAHLTRAVGLAREGLAEARRSVQALRLGALERAGLHEALSALVERMFAGSGVDATFRLAGTPRPLPAEMTADLLRIGQEALTNSLRHAGARAVFVELSYEDEGVSLRVSDDGVGFEVERAAAGDGFGLLGMRERARRIGAALTVRSVTGRGTEVIAEVAYGADARPGGARPRAGEIRDGNS